MPNLSKSQFIRGLQCHKSLWLYKYKPQLREQPDDGVQAKFDAGTEVGILARRLFPNGEEIVFEPGQIQKNIRKTCALIDAGTCTIYEATFIYDDVLVMVDILHRDENGLQFFEVKSSTEVKSVHIEDVAIQYYVLKGCGLNISSASVVHINNQYIRHGDLNLHELFNIADITEAVFSAQDIVHGELSSMKAMLQDHMPNIDIGTQCTDPYPCDFKSHCWSHIPQSSVFELTRLNSNKKFELYYKGIIKLDQIPDTVPLTPAQHMQIESEHDSRRFINEANLKSFIEQLDEPIGFLDFETFQEAIPSFDKQRPYQQVPFQYSLHKLVNGDLTHYEFLSETGIDPRPEFVEKLLHDIAGCQTIIVYNQGFENGRMKELARLYPEYSEELHAVCERIIDLMKPFQNKDYYVREMQGSYSIKKVLPALIPGMGYGGMAISDGGMASATFLKLRDMDQEAALKARQALLKYCEMDTLAMVKILEHLKQIVS